MTNVWYMGTAAARVITVAQWAAAGVAGVTKDSRWDITNRWALPLADFNTAQRTILTADGLFWLSAPDTGRPSDAVLAPDGDPLPQYVRDVELFGSDGKIRTDLLPPDAGGTGDVTAEQLADALAANSTADRDRTNHSGTQALNTITIGGTPNGSRFLRDDGTWADPPTGGTGTATVTTAAMVDALEATGDTVGAQLLEAADAAAARAVIGAYAPPTGTYQPALVIYTGAAPTRPTAPAGVNLAVWWLGPQDPGAKMLAQDRWETLV